MCVEEEKEEEILLLYIMISLKLPSFLFIPHTDPVHKDGSNTYSVQRTEWMGVHQPKS